MRYRCQPPCRYCLDVFILGPQAHLVSTVVVLGVVLVNLSLLRVFKVSVQNVGRNEHVSTPTNDFGRFS